MRTTRIDLTAQRFGRLVVMGGPLHKSKRKVWKCKCDCGAEAIVEESKLKTGHTKSCGCRRKDILFMEVVIGEIYGKLTVIQDLGMKQGATRNYHYVLAKCECGSIKEYLFGNLKKGNTSCCGCIKPDLKGESLVGQKFGRLLIIKEANPTKKNQRRYIAQCECGRVKTFLASNLVKGATKSCGCLAKEITSKRFLNKSLSIEHINKLSETHKGNIGFWKNKKFSETHRSKLSITRTGKPLSHSTRIKMSEKQKERIANGKHNFWKGGLTKENHTIRGNVDYRIWREKVFRRDNWTCQNCGTRGTFLNAHHIRSFSQYPELRFVVDNGKTLCKLCHAKMHSHKIN